MALENFNKTCQEQKVQWQFIVLFIKHTNNGSPRYLMHRRHKYNGTSRKKEKKETHIFRYRKTQHYILDTISWTLYPSIFLMIK